MHTRPKRDFCFFGEYPRNHLFLFALMILMGGSLWAQPSNDAIANATGLAINGCSADAAFNTFNATSDGIAGSCWPSGPNANVWFSFVANVTGTVQINLDRGVIPGDMTGDMRYAMMSLWDVTGTIEIACSTYTSVDDDISILANGLINGTTYLISIDRANPTPAAAETFKLCLSDTPTNDYFEGATNIDIYMNGCSLDAEFTTLGATADRNAGSCWPNVVGPGPYRNVWFEVNATATGTIEVKLDSGGAKGALQTSMLALWEADGITEVSCNSYRIGYDYDDVSLLATGLTPNSPYYVSVDNTYIHALDTFSLCLSDTATNDYYEGATDITGLIGTCSANEAYSTLGNTFDRNTGSCWPSIVNHNTWFRFDAPPSGRIQIDLDRGGAQGTLRHAYMSLWSTDGTTELACTTYSDPEDVLRIKYWSLTPGSVYYISVDNRYITTTDTFTLCLDALNDPDIDGDGVGDAVDLDDDNDGIFDTVEGCQTTDISGTIGIGNNVPNSVTYPLIGTDITYTLNNPDNIDIFGYDAGANGHSIRVEANAGDAGSMTTTYSTPISGVQFKLSDFDHSTQYTVEVYDENNALYDLANEGIVSLGSQITQTGNYFEAQVGDVDGDDPADDALGSILFYFPGQVSRIVLTFNHPVNSSTRFTQPVYCIQDTDIDGIPDFHDLDSDGDGIPDNVEAQETLLYTAPTSDTPATYVTNNGVNSAYLGGLTPTNTDGADNPDYLDTDSDNEGANDTVEANIALTSNDADNDGLDDATDAAGDYTDVGGTIDDPLTAPIILPDLDGDASSGGDVDFRDTSDDRNDTDGDGVPDATDLDDDNDGILDTVEGNLDLDGDLITNNLDLDSDNDGIPDNVEGQTTIGYIEPNSDDAATYSTNNGVNSAYLGGVAPTNTDGVDLPDYLDTDSDNEGGNDTLEAQITLLNTDGDNDGLDDATDATVDYSDVGGTIDNPLSGAIILLDTDKDAPLGGDVDFRDAQDDRLDTDTDGIADAIDLDDDNDGLLDSEELNVIIGNTQPDCTGETILDFSTAPTLESGSALQQGAVYRFPNVATGTDALVTIMETFNASVADIDNNSQEIQAFRPRTAFDISNVGKEGYIEYHMQFVNSGGTTAVTVPKFFININDTDGNVDYSEEIYVENPANYIISNPTELSLSYEFPWVVATAGTTEYTGAGNTFPQINFGINYRNRSEIRFRAGITTIVPAVAASGREHNLDFRCTTNYVNPEIYTLDSDGDGLPNPIDLDTDNDGIFDVTEAGHGQSQTNGRVNGTVGADGVPDAVQSDPNGGTVNYMVAESTDDADVLANFADLDADGDGLPDNLEAQTTIGYIAPNGTVDANGVDTAYASGLAPTNTDGADNPDYLDTDSDNEGGSDTQENRITLTTNDIDSDGLDDATDADTSGYTDPGGTIDNPLTAPIILFDVDGDATTGGDVDFRDAQDNRPDNDNDGIPDVIDLDDDNDGILDTDEGCGNLIINGSFEQDDFTDTVAYPNGFTAPNGTFIGTTYNTNTLTAWNYTQNLDGWVGGAPNGSITFAPAYQGVQYLDIIGNDNVTGGATNELFQVISTVPGNSYTLSFYWGEDVGHAAGQLVSVDVDVIDSNSASIVDRTLTANAVGEIGSVRGPKTWFYHEEIFVAATSQTRVQFSATHFGTNTGAGADLDLVSVLNNGACDDTDNDGVPNSLDLDSDNDGIFDAVEAGHGRPHTNGTVNGTVGTDGVPDAVQTDPNRETVNYTLSDFDTDGINDILDLDADGDGIPDNVEAQTTIGYAAPNGTVDANGVDTAYVPGLVPTNTDGTDNPDYLDLDSDNEGGNDNAEAAITLSGNDVDNDGLDDVTDEDITGHRDPGGTVDDPLATPVLLPDSDNDASTGGDVDFRDAISNPDLDTDNDGILDSLEDLNADGDDDPSTNPTNSDGDLYPDYLDIDSDNDGIPDNVEAQTTSEYIPPSLQDTNGNGLDDVYEIGVNIGLFPVNTDNEDLPDYLDLDSDNDNVSDAIEAHDINSDGLPNVTFIGSDKDDDGLDDGYEGIEALDIDVNDEIDNPFGDLPNTDSDGESDYRDIDDDGDGIPTSEEDTNSDGNYANDDENNNGIPNYLEEPYVEVEVFNVVTPNGDGVHDILTITGLEERPDNNLQIFNRWGILLYMTESYNTAGNYFEGRSLARLTSGKEEQLPTGTYFYIFVYEDTTGESKTLSGYLYLN